MRRYPRELTLHRPRLGADEERRAVTVCVAVLCKWNYALPPAAPDMGTIAIAISDRKITAFDVEYEPPQQKLAFITERALVLVAGDLAFHTEAIYATRAQIKGNIEASPQNIALIYGQAVQSIRRRRAEDVYLAPLGLNTDSFLAQQRDLSESFVDQIRHQLQEYRADQVEALVVASDGDTSHIYSVDERGGVSCLDDVGFAAIGIGAWHAKSRLMQWGYTNGVNFGAGLAAAFAAKKAAEAAPGVGTTTDINIVFRNKSEPLLSAVAEKLPEFYEEYKVSRAKLEDKIMSDLNSFISTLGSPTEKS
jgi:hypothetical protein